MSGKMRLSLVVVFCVVLVPIEGYAQTLWPDQFKSLSEGTEPPADFTHIPKRTGHYTASDWSGVIDSTWGPGLPTSTKLQLFDAAWNTLNADFAAFQGLDIDWNSLRDVYRPIVADTVNPISRGRFAAIMNYLGLALKESHTFIDDKQVNWYTPLDPGVPLFVVGAWADNSHFGASLTPLPDSSLLVFKALPDHPLGLVPGDIVLGYNGIPWKILYRELLTAQLPIYKPYLWGSAESAMTHNMLMSAGMNWHLFDTLDVVKYATGDTVHYATAPLAGQSGFIWGNEQLNIPGVPWPDINGEDVVIWSDIKNLGDYVSWGIVEGTQIGYIYAIAGFRNSQVPGSNISTEFYNAVDSLMSYYETTGLILDLRLNYGGSWYTYSQGLSLLFNSNIETVAFDGRCGDPNGHFNMCPYVTCSDHAIPGDPMTYYDRPIAVLTGPGAVSAGDLFPLYMTYHPMVKIFGKSTAGAFSGGKVSDLLGYADWHIWTTILNLYMCDDPGNYLARIETKVDEEVWLTKEGVAQGEDAVVKRAIEWIQGPSSVQDGEDILPGIFALYPAYPNPFNTIITISYQLSELSFVNLSIYNVTGQLVEILVNDEVQTGYHNVTWNSTNVGSGVYFYKITAGEYSATGNCLLLK